MTHSGNYGFLETLAQDVRYSLRVLRKSPVFTIAAVLTLALGIGANAVVFSVMNALILRPLSVPQPESLFMIWQQKDDSGFQSYPDYLDLRDRNRSFDSLAAANITGAGLDTGGAPSLVFVYEVSGNYFDALGIQPYLGRLIHSSDERGPNSAPYVVLTFACWHTRFQEDRNILGHVIHINKHPFTVVGVAPPEFHGTLLFFSPDLFLPLVNHEQLAGANMLNDRGNRWIFMTVGHLKRGVARAQAVADINSIGSYLESTYPKDDVKMTFSLARPGLYGNYLGPPVRAFMTALMTLAGLILLAACANLGSLFAARASDRSREVALRLALGASRNRILRTLFTEAKLISLAGGVLGLGASIVLLRALSAWQPIPKFPIHLSVTPDATVYAVALLLTVASGFLFGAVPVRQVLGTNPYEIVKSGARTIGGRRFSLRDALLVVQVAICAVLVTSSIVAVRGLDRSLHSNFGFDVANTTIVNADLSMADYTGDRIPAMQKRILATVKSISGVESVGMSDGVPLADGGSGTRVFNDSTTDLRPGNAAADATVYNISAEFLHAAGTTLLAGRMFTEHDSSNAPRVAIVNREFARKVFRAPANAIGDCYKLADGSRIQVVGIVQDGKYGSLTEKPQAVAFVPMLQSPEGLSYTWLVVRSDRDPTQLGTAIRIALRQLDASLPIYIESRYKSLDPALFPARMATISLGVMGVIGAVLAVTGIFGMAAYSVSKRLRELGVRMALGAKRKEILQAALGHPIKLLALGSSAGLLLGILAARVLAAIVYQATPRDPFVLSGVVIAMALLGLLATWIPARRALSLDPMRLLREE